MKKLALLLLMVMVTGLTFSGCKRLFGSKAEPTPAPKKKVGRPVNIIPYDQRPYVVMAPTQGREVQVTIKTLPKAAEGADYLAEYEHGAGLGGNEQFIDLGDGLPATKEFALYSRSAGGKTTYEDAVKGGNIQIDFQGQEEYSVKQDWVYSDNKTKQTAFSSKDSKFKIESPSFSTLQYMIVYNSPGIPAAFPTERVSEVYTFQTVPKPAAKDITVTFQVDGGAQGSIYGYDGKAWKKFTSTPNGDALSAKVELMEAYVVGK